MVLPQHHYKVTNNRLLCMKRYKTVVVICQTQTNFAGHTFPFGSVELMFGTAIVTSSLRTRFWEIAHI